MKEEKEKSQSRARYARGQVTTKPMTFKVDLDIAEWLKKVKNKGRLINDLLREKMEFETTLN